MGTKEDVGLYEYRNKDVENKFQICITLNLPGFSNIFCKYSQHISVKDKDILEILIAVNPGISGKNPKLLNKIIFNSALL
jgi:hypothetical protein